MLLALLLAQADPVAALDAELMAANSATAVLQKRCDEPIRAEREPVVARDAMPLIRARLGATSLEKILYRRVRLKCGDKVFSTAENWYLPGQLTPEMNRLLTGSDTPYGVVIRDLSPTRRTFEAERLKSGGVLRHSALVISEAKHTLALVIETYTEEAAAAASR